MANATQKVGAPMLASARRSQASRHSGKRTRYSVWQRRSTRRRAAPNGLRGSSTGSTTLTTSSRLSTPEAWRRDRSTTNIPVSQRALA
eukprot:2851868-Prymnesium_polylepis.1